MQKSHNCNICFQRFSDHNPPRLIPNCGHYFCENCIRNKIIPSQPNVYYLICPTDKKLIKFEHNDINKFPKYSALIKPLQNILEKIDLSFSDIIMSNESKIMKEQFYDDHNIQSICSKKNGIEIDSIQNILNRKDIIVDQFSFVVEDICLIHQKRLQIVCIQDSAMICSNCAIFGDHKGHEFRSIQQVQTDKFKKRKAILHLFDQKESICKKINMRETKQQIKKNLKIKFEQMINIIKEKFKKITEILIDSEKKSLKKLQTIFQIVQDKIISDLKFIEYPLSQYTTWQDQALKELSILESKNNFQQQLLLLDYLNTKKQKNLIDQGTMILNSLENYSKSQNQKIQEHVSKICIEFNQQMDKNISEFSNIYLQQSKKTNLINQQQLLIKENSIIQQLLLDHSTPTKKSKNSQKTYNLSCTQSMKKIKNDLSPVSSRNTNLFTNVHSPNKIKELLDIGGFKQLIKKKFRLKLPQKYQKIVQTILNDNTDVLDLSNAELGDQTILQILQLLKTKKLRIIKLVRNKLSDEICDSIFGLISSSVSILNLSQNNLSDKILQVLLANYKKVPNLKSIILIQNKIKQRNMKTKLEQLKKYDIIVSL